MSDVSVSPIKEVSVSCVRSMWVTFMYWKAELSLGPIQVLEPGGAVYYKMNAKIVQVHSFEQGRKCLFFNG